MNGPTGIFPEGDYNSREGGAAREFFGIVPYAGSIKGLTVAINVLAIDPNTNVNITLEESLDGHNWSMVELLSGTPITATGYMVFHSSKDFGAMARVRMKVEASTGTIAVNSRLDGRISGKPF